MISTNSLPGISILLPVHNGGAYLAEAIESVLAQTFRSFELLVIDDCSTDGSAQLVQSYVDDRIILITLDKQAGICKALNCALDVARGKYLARMDADDICHVERLQKQVDYLESHPLVGICGTWVKRFGENQVSQLYKGPTGYKKIRAFTFFDNPLVHSSVMLRGDLVRDNDIRYREDFAGAEDYELWTRLLEITEAENIPEVLLEYRVHPQSVTLSKSELMDSLACRILTNEFSRLGMIVSEQEVLQHRLWSTGRIDRQRGREEVENVECWLKRLVMANEQSQLHDNKAFIWAVRQIWFALCYRYQALGHPILSRFWLSSLSCGDIKNGCILAGARVKMILG